MELLMYYCLIVMGSLLQVHESLSGLNPASLPNSNLAHRVMVGSCP